MESDVFKLMGVDRDMSYSEAIKVAKDNYKRLAKEWHPDVNPTPNASKMFNNIKDAYDKITNREEFYKLRDDMELTDSPDIIIKNFWDNI